MLTSGGQGTVIQVRRSIDALRACVIIIGSQSTLFVFEFFFEIELFFNFLYSNKNDSELRCIQFNLNPQKTKKDLQLQNNYSIVDFS